MTPAYDPILGRFLQTDPIRYGDGGNIYAYVHGDPVNGTDPSGLMGDDNTVDALVITANLKDPLQHLDLQLSDLKINFDIDINISVADLAGFNFTGPKCDSEGSCVSTDLDSVTVIGAKHPRLTGVADFDSLGGVPIAVAVSVTPAPQNTQANQSKDQMCKAKVGVTLALDVAGVGGSLLPGENLAVAGANLALNTASMVNSGVQGSPEGVAFGAVGYHLSAFGPAAATLGKGFAESVPVVGTVFAVGVLAYDGSQAQKAYNDCMSGR